MSEPVAVGVEPLLPFPPPLATSCGFSAPCAVSDVLSLHRKPFATAEAARDNGALMKAKLLRNAGEIIEGTDVEIASRAGTNDVRSDKDVGGRSTTVAPVYEVTDDEGHAEKVDTRDLKPEP